MSNEPRHSARRYLAAMFEQAARFVRSYLSRLALGAALGLLLYGSLSDWELGRMLVLLVVLRGAWLLREALRRPMRAGDWERLYGTLVVGYEQSSPERRAAAARAMGLDDNASAATLATAEVAAARRAYVPPREGADLASEAVGLVAFALLIPGALALYTRPFVFMPSEFGWLPPLVAAVCLGLYALPLLRPETVFGRQRRLWWTAPALPAAVLAAIAIGRWHPYLNPLRADRQKLAAVRVLSLRNNIIAGKYAGWVVAYARTLEAQGDVDRARGLYRKTLQLDPQHREARQRLAALEPQHLGTAAASSEPGPQPFMPDAPPQAPLWTADDRAETLPRCRIDDSLQLVERTGIVMVRAGAVPDWLVDVVGAVLQRELSLPICVAEPALVLPPSTRQRGLVIGAQWSMTALLQGLGGRPLPVSPVVYLVLTEVPIYTPGTNFLFSQTFPWGAVVSFDQFGSPELPNLVLANRTAKSALGAILKTFGAPVSPDVDCVTSYCKSLAELDAKGHRPSAAAFAAYRRALVARDRRWARRERISRGP